MNETLIATFVISAIIFLVGWFTRALHEGSARSRLERVRVRLSEHENQDATTPSV